MLVSNTASNSNCIHIQHIHREALLIRAINSYKMCFSIEQCVDNLILQFESKRLKLGCVYLLVDYIYRNSKSKKRQLCRQECFNESKCTSLISCMNGKVVPQCSALILKTTFPGFRKRSGNEQIYT